MLTAPNIRPQTLPDMNSIRAFIISSSTFIVVWLAASYTTQLEKAKPVPAAQQPAAMSNVSTSVTTDRKQDPHQVR